MTLEELAHKEEELYSKAITLHHQSYTEETETKLNEIFIEYRKVHQHYASLSFSDIEALKRGLFLQWYALSEPNYLTGISDLDKPAENEILKNLDKLISAEKIDSELIWMLNYYSSQEWILDRISSFKGFDKEIVNEKNNKLPITIDKEAMKLRGQMGKYWNSLTAFSNG